MSIWIFNRPYWEGPELEKNHDFVAVAIGQSWRRGYARFGWSKPHQPSLLDDPNDEANKAYFNDPEVKGTQPQYNIINLKNIKPCEWIVQRHVPKKNTIIAAKAKQNDTGDGVYKHLKDDPLRNAHDEKGQPDFCHGFCIDPDTIITFGSYDDGVPNLFKNPRSKFRYVNDPNKVANYIAFLDKKLNEAKEKRRRGLSS